MNDKRWDDDPLIDYDDVLLPDNHDVQDANVSVTQLASSPPRRDVVLSSSVAEEEDDGDLATNIANTFIDRFSGSY